jgi:hypothetical protein
MDDFHDIVIKLNKPLDKKMEAVIIDNFNKMFIGSSDYSPMYEGNRTVSRDGSIHLNGSDQTEGRYTTELLISGNKTTIQTDRRGRTGQDVEEILKKNKIGYELTDFYSKHPELDS